jgi:hypothetical protein
MNILRGLILGLSIVTVSVCGLAAALTEGRMIDAVNKQSAPADRLVAIGRPWSQRGRVVPEYRRLFPDGPLLRRLRYLVAGLFGGLVISAVVMGFGFAALWMAAGCGTMWWLTFAPDLRRHAEP